MEGITERIGKEVSAGTPSAIPTHLRTQVEVQTSGGTSIGDIVISQEQTLAELRMIADEFERELEEELDNSRKSTTSKDKMDMENRNKKGPQKKKKRKREDDEEEEETDDEDVGVRDGEKVFKETRTDRAHYLQIIKEMEYTKGMPAVILLANMIEWVLACEVRRQKSKNINGNIAR